MAVCSQKNVVQMDLTNSNFDPRIGQTVVWVAIVSQVFDAWFYAVARYRTITARYVAKGGMTVLHRCACVKKLSTLSVQRYRAIWGIASIALQYSAIWGLYKLGGEPIFCLASSQDSAQEVVWDIQACPRA